MKRTTADFSTVAFMILWLVLSAGLADAAMASVAGEDVAQYPNNSCSYRGIVVGNFSGTGTNYDDEIVGDFGSQGVWLWDSGVWTQLSGADPERIISGYMALGETLVGDFGSMGLWQWDDFGGWYQLSGHDVSYMMILDDNADGIDDLHAAFPGYGLWRLSGNDHAWTPMATSVPLVGLVSDFATAWGKEGVHCFGPSGVWLFYKENPGGVISLQLSAATAGDDHAAANFGGVGAPGSLIMDFGPLGMWLAEDQGAFNISWKKLSDNEPLRVKEVILANSAGYFYTELLCDFKSVSVSGLYNWRYYLPESIWTKITGTEPGPGFCEPFNLDADSIGGDADEEVAVDFESLGLWVFKFQDESWIQLSALDPVFMVRIDLHGSLVTNCLVVDFGPGVGLWCYDGSAKTWIQLSSQSPDESFDSD
jgi:hypothetical protein